MSEETILIDAAFLPSKDRLETRRWNGTGKIIGAWIKIGENGADTGDYYDFHGIGVIQMQTPFGVLELPMKFGIGCKTWEEAWPLYEQSAQTHLNAWSENQRKAQQAQLQQAYMDQKAAQAADEIRRAAGSGRGGIVIAQQ